MSSGSSPTADCASHSNAKLIQYTIYPNVARGRLALYVDTFARARTRP